MGNLNLFIETDQKFHWINPLGTDLLFTDFLVLIADQNDFSSFEEYSSFLDKEESKRYEKLFHHRNKSNFLLSRVILKCLINKLSGVAVKDVRLSSIPDIKPILLNPQKNWHFSLAHAGNMVALSFSKKYKNGIDIEPLKFKKSIDLVIESYFTEAEKRELKDAKNIESLFFDYWTRKEAASKLIGSGLLEHIKLLDVSHKQHVISDFQAMQDISSIFLYPFEWNDYKACVAFSSKADKICGIKINRDILDNWLAQ